jgi:hypothetical protein
MKKLNLENSLEVQKGLGLPSGMRGGGKTKE